jgi:uridine kinase
VNFQSKIKKIVNKHGEVADYKPEKVINSIVKTIIDVEHATQWVADMRAKMYFELIDKAIYDEFYNTDFLFEKFFKKYISFVISERHRRLENSYVMERLAIQILFEFKNLTSNAVLNKENVIKFLDEKFDNIGLTDKYQRGLFPVITEEEKIDMLNFLYEKIVYFSKQQLSITQLYPTREFVMDIIEDVLKKIGEIELAEGFMIFREGKKKVRNGEISVNQFTKDGIHYEICEKTLLWNIEHKCENIFDLNDWVTNRAGRNIRELIELSDKRFMDDVLFAVKKILDRKDKIRMVIIAGPSCSNKTTTTTIINNELAKHGFKLKMLNVDDYFKDLKDQPKDEYGDYDFEMPEAIDMELLNKHFESLLNGETIQKPCYNFKTGCRDRFVPYKLEKDEILLIDCLHGLYRQLTHSVPPEKKFKIYIESMNMLRDVENHYTRWTDVRMLKRMIRDVKYRNHKTDQTLAHWPYVRKGELKHIIPYIFSTDIVINSGLPYELPALKKSLEGLFPSDEFIENLRKEGRLDPYIRGKRIKSLLSTVEPMSDLSIIPSTSPLREFIGGSSYYIPHNE